MTNIAVILAGGMGSRVGGTMPKQLLLLEDGRSILEHSVDAFEQAECIDEVGIVMHKDYVAQAEAMVQCNKWKKVTWVIEGGNERWQSSVNAISQIRMTRHIEKDPLPITDENAINILLHDAARPFVSQQIIQDVCTALTHHEAVTVAIPATDTIYQVHYTNNGKDLASGNVDALACGNANNNNANNTDENTNDTENRVISSIPQRQSIMYAQTPQAFRLSTIDEAYRLALQDSTLQATATPQTKHLQATDDCGILHQYLPDVPIYIVQGSPSNRKITYPEDLSKTK